MSVQRYDSEGHYGSTFESDDGEFVKYEDYAKMKRERDALAVENAKLADCANFYRLGFRPVKGPFGIEYKPTEQLLDDCGNTALEAVTTPATDAAIAAIQAQGLEKYACSLESSADDAERDGYDDAVKFLRSEASGVRLFAAQLRKDPIHD